MAYTTPTAADLKARYPAFASVADATVESVIAEANRFVDESWFEADYAPAIIHLTAHMLAMEGALGGNPGTAGLITSEKLGDAQTSYGAAISETKTVSDYGATAYGRAFLRLLRVNQPAVLTV